jgi:perosamine synthetase
MCSALLPKDVDRAKLMAFLSDAGIETRPGFYPVHTMPMHANWPSSKLQFKNAAELGARILNLPSWPGLSDEQVESVAQSLVQGCEVQKGRKMGEGRP